MAFPFRVAALLLVTALPVAALFAGGCAFPDTPPPDEPITVEGRVAVRGNEPFAAYVLRTDDRNAYVLTFESGADRPQTPAHLRVTGTLYLDDWNGRPYAHLRVQAWERSEG